MLGMVHVPEYSVLAQALHECRLQLLQDPYFAGVPSMAHSAKKTAVLFHAKDDLPEVRREVFSLLRRHPIHFYAVIRDKYILANEENRRRMKDANYRYNPNALYDSLVGRLFKDSLHQYSAYDVFFARRGTTDRTSALNQALLVTRQRSVQRWKLEVHPDVTITACASHECIGLQITDYLLWALQRYYERHESRFLELIWPSVCLIHDMDDLTGSKDGTYYSEKNQPPFPAAGKTVPGI
jgi:hypothetical protein